MRRAAVHELTLRLKREGAQEELIEAIGLSDRRRHQEQAFVRIFECAVKPAPEQRPRELEESTPSAPRER